MIQKMKSRTKNTLRNSIVGLIAQLISAIVSFISRQAFIYVLGVEYLGISGLFSNILTMLSLTDLGIYTVMVYSLYKPLANNDNDTVNALVHYYQKLYNWVALIVFALGIACIPFLPYLVNNTTLPYKEMVWYYFLLLLNSVCSYFAISKSSLLRADQNVFIVQIINTSCNLLLQFVQIAVLYLTHLYTLYLVCHIAFTLISNLIKDYVAKRKYPYLKTKADLTLIGDTKKGIINNLKATFLYKIGATIMNSTDNILISTLVSTIVVGYYSNYSTIYAMVNTFVMIIVNGVLASLGNYYVKEKDEDKYRLFKALLLVFYGIATFCTGCYLAGMNDFISIWLGNEFVISGGFIYALSFYRFVFCSIHPLWMTRESSGVFVSTRYVMMAAAAINIILSIVLGKLYGITGIILATALSDIVTVFWYEPLQLSKKVFHNSMSSYWLHIGKLLLTACPCLVIAALAGQFLPTENIFFLIGKFVACGIMTLLVFIIMFKKSEELQWCFLLLEKVPFIGKLAGKVRHLFYGIAKS